MRSIRILLFALLLACEYVTAAQQQTVLVFGDSLSAAHGLKTEQGWVALLQNRLRSEGYGYTVVNASASGETTAGGRLRLPRALEQHKPSIVVLELGANDGLRGLPLQAARTNFEAMITTIRQANAKVLLAGILVPPNYGPKYSEGFAEMYRQLAAEQKLPFVPFLLDGIALDPRLMQEDGYHPNAEGQPRMLENVWRYLRPLLER